MISSNPVMRAIEVAEALRRLTYVASDGSLWHVDLAEWSPAREHDWQALHDDFGGPGDDRWLDGPSRDACCELVEEWLAENPDARRADYARIGVDHVMYAHVQGQIRAGRWACDSLDHNEDDGCSNSRCFKWRDSPDMRRARAEIDRAGGAP